MSEQEVLRLQELKFQSTIEHLDKVRPLRELALIYRALRGDAFAQRYVSVRRARLYHYDVYMTFYEFIRMNWLPVYEEVLR